MLPHRGRFGEQGVSEKLRFMTEDGRPRTGDGVWVQLCFTTGGKKTGKVEDYPVCFLK